MLNVAVQNLFNLSGKSALITGGSRGLGLQMATVLGQAGCRVMLCSRKESDLQTATESLKSLGIDAQHIAGNCADEADISRITDHTVKWANNKVDILINNAGATWGSSMEDHDVSAFDKVMDLNLRGYFLLSREIGRKSMIPNKSGKIINISSIAGLGMMRGVYLPVLLCDCRREPQGTQHDCLQHVQGSSHHLHTGPGVRVGQIQHQCMYVACLCVGV